MGKISTKKTENIYVKQVFDQFDYAIVLSCYCNSKTNKSRCYICQNYKNMQNYYLILKIERVKDTS